MRFVYLPPVADAPPRWINPQAVEWFAPMGCESVIRLRTGDTLRTSLAVTALADRLLESSGPRLSFEPHDVAEEGFP